MEGVRENLISYLSAPSVWSNSTKVSGAETLWCSALKSVCESWEEVTLFCQVDVKGTSVVGHVWFAFHSWSLSNSSSTVSHIMLILFYFPYGVKYRDINVSCPNYWRAQSCSYNCATGFLNKKPEPELHQQCAPLHGSAARSCWRPVILQESCRFHIILNYWCADSPARVMHLLYWVISAQAYRQSLTWWWAMQEELGTETLLKYAEFP